MSELILTKTALNALSILIPVLKKSVNKKGIIPCGISIDSNGIETISLLRQLNDIRNAGDLSHSQVASLLLSGSYLKN